MDTAHHNRKYGQWNKRQCLSPKKLRQTLKGIPTKFTLHNVLDYMDNRKVFGHATRSAARHRIEAMKKLDAIERTDEKKKIDNGYYCIYRIKDKYQ